MHASTPTPVFPHQHIPLERADGPTWLAAVELAACLGRGQRCLIVGPPGCGKTSLLAELGRSISANAPDVEIHVLVVDQRPEEQAAWRNWLPGGTLHGTTHSASLDEHAATVKLFARWSEQAKSGEHVVVLVDSLAALARVLNVTAAETDRVLSGGLLATALIDLRAVFSTARAYENGGSLTIVATAAVESHMEADDVVFHEMVGTGNSEIRLDHALLRAEIWPPLDLERSGTRRDELILGDAEAVTRAKMRAEITDTEDAAQALRRLLDQLADAGSLTALRQR